MSNSLVQYSRAGDAFHYRWAARRCLHLVYPHANVWKIVIEGSDDATKEGEYVIDVAEYSKVSDQQYINYYQLKHSTVQVDDPFTLSDLEDTITGFSKRYSEWKNQDAPHIKFSVITNRKIADSFKDGIKAIADDNSSQAAFKATLEKYTGLSGDDLRGFCQILSLQDSEGDYNVQQEELKNELAKVIADEVDPVQINNLVEMVREKVLPNARNTIVREDVLKRFGITSERHLYPAPAELEPPATIIELPQYQSLKDQVNSASGHVIIHAEGGVGKSVFCRHLVESLPAGSVGIIYDCFGAGKYRNRSEPRHGHRQALTQIVNELASKGLCGPLILYNTTRDEDIVRTFLDRMATVVAEMRKVVPQANLYILIDAADNAEMAANEFGETGFAHELIREQMLEGCRLIFLCRTERIHLLQPAGSVLKLKLDSFSEPETLLNLRVWFPMCSEQDGREFHRLTNANPRVQANALTVKYGTVQELLVSLGPGGLSVEKLIESQLKAAVDKIKHQLSSGFEQQINAICLGLAILPPHIPISVLSRASNVDESTIKSFVSDIGRSLWILDSSVQFRDEPTETWFRGTFAGNQSDYVTCLNLLEPLAPQSTYVAEVLPQLYLLAGQYEKLIKVSLTDDHLPTDNPIDARTIRVSRLQFAFKAALKTKRTTDAIQVAIKAGEEVAGNKRQLQLLAENIDLLVKLQSKEKVQEIAFRQELSSAWDGSENIYTASLLSGIKEYQGEARGYLRAGLNWLRIALDEEQKRRRNKSHMDNKINDKDFVETAYAMLNLEGVPACVDFLNHFNPMYVFGVLKQLIDRLMDQGRFDEIDELAINGKGYVHYTVAIVSETMRLGKIPERSVISVALDLLCHAKGRIKKPAAHQFDRSISRAIVTFAECCLMLDLPPEKILRVLRHYIPTRADRSVGNDRFSDERPIFMKAFAIRLTLAGLADPNLEEIYPKNFLKEKKNHDEQNEVTEFKELVMGLLPWYLLRARILKGENPSLMVSASEAQTASNKARGTRYRSHDHLPDEIAYIGSSILVLLKNYPVADIQLFYEKFLKPKDTLLLPSKLNLLNAAGRLTHLSSIRSELENTTREIVKSIKSDGPDAIAARYLTLARAVLTNDPADARVYFDHAIEIASKFGDEVVQRWEALVGLAEQASVSTVAPDSLAYRFARCAEVVGDTVDREKHWNRYDAMRVCTKMSPGVGLSAVSRWRDRDIGEFQYELLGAVKQLLSTSKIDSSIAWSMARFFPSQRNEKFLIRCLSKTASQSLRQTFVADDIRLNRMEGVDISYWNKTRKIADEWIIDKEWIKQTFSFLDGIPDDNPKALQPESEIRSTRPSTNWEEVFRGIDMTTTQGFSELVTRHRTIIGDEPHGNPTHSLLQECVSRLAATDLTKFVDTLLATPHLDKYDVQGVLENIPQTWRQKVSFEAQWKSIIHKFSKRFAYTLSDSYGFDSLVRAIKADEKLQLTMIEGINEGLIEAKDLDSGETFFAYAMLSARCVSEEEARSLLDYALTRFEQHFEPDAGDGDWSTWLEGSNDTNQNLAGVVWSALGSPRAAERWNAAHCVRTLVELDCSAVLDALMKWAENDSVGAFGSKQFPFYSLHARQYLLIALARISMDYPERLVKYAALLKKFALESDHILIQKFARDVCLNIESKLSGTFDAPTIEQLSDVAKSKFPIREEKRYDFKTDSYWHANKLVDEDVNYHFAWDFDRYWYEPLAEVFGIPEKQVEDLAASLLTKEWRSDYDGTHKNDPRSGIWNRYSSERETWHDHGSYPKVDNLDFYLAYHAMMVVAGRLLQKMPMLSSTYEDGNTWKNWLSRHLLTRKDGKWLADHRDSLPIVRPAWLDADKQSFDEWKVAISDEDFTNCLIQKENNKRITAKGGWHEKKSERIETCYVSSAFVSKPASDALMRAWTTVVDHHDYKVPEYEEEDMEFDTGIFKLKGWIIDPNNERELDEFDPYARKIEYPSYSIGQSFLDLVNVRGDADGKKWFDETNTCIGACNTWVSSHADRDEETDQGGMRLAVDLKIALQLCAALNCELIIEVSITRRLSYSHRSRQDDSLAENEQHRIFILNEHGELRTIGKSYRVG